MTEYRTSRQAVWDIKYHLIWITKYRYKVLRGEVAERARDLIRQICQAREVSIIRGAISPDHIHMLVAAPPQLSPAKRMGGCSARAPRQERGAFFLSRTPCSATLVASSRSLLRLQSAQGGYP